MDNNILMELGDIQTELDSSIGLISVIADGLSTCSREYSMSDGSGQRYVNALYMAFDILTGISEKLREQLDCEKNPGA